MNILLSNDDGVLAPGLQILFESLQANPRVGDIVIPPKNNRG